MGRKRKFQDEDIDYIYANYKREGTERLAERYNTTPGSIRAVFSKELRRREEELYYDTDY